MVNTIKPERFLVATVGTDHHKFDRLIEWLDHWLLEHTAVTALVQHGASKPPSQCDKVDLLPRRELLTHFRSASVVVTQGGPGSIMDARSCGRIPVAVPRLPTLGEVVDDHQVAFCRKMADEGLVHLAESEAELKAHLERAQDDPTSYRTDVADRSIGETVIRLNAVLSDVLDRPPGSLRMRRVGQLIRAARLERERGGTP